MPSLAGAGGSDGCEGRTSFAMSDTDPLTVYLSKDVMCLVICKQDAREMPRQRPDIRLPGRLIRRRVSSPGRMADPRGCRIVGTPAEPAGATHAPRHPGTSGHSRDH